MYVRYPLHAERLGSAADVTLWSEMCWPRRRWRRREDGCEGRGLEAWRACWHQAALRYLPQLRGVLEWTYVQCFSTRMRHLLIDHGLTGENYCAKGLYTGLMTPGTYQQYLTSPAIYTTRIPEGVSDEVAGPIMCSASTMHRALIDSGLKAGQWVVFPGGGGGVGIQGVSPING